MMIIQSSSEFTIFEPATAEHVPAAMPGRICCLAELTSWQECRCCSCPANAPSSHNWGDRVC